MVRSAQYKQNYCKSCNYKCKHNGALRVITWNVNSWTKENCHLRESILLSLHADIIFLNETKLKGKEQIELKGYSWFGHNRQNQLKTAKSGSGGVGLLVREELLNDWYINEIDSMIDGLYIVSLNNRHNDVKLLLNPCYLPPENSPWGNDSEAFFNHLTSFLYSLDDIDLLICAGDFNARIGKKLDFIQDVDDVPNRNVIDHTCNKNGEAFIDFLLSNKLCVLNGRINGCDNFTYIKPNGRSVVDYFISFIECLPYFKHMYVKTCREISDDLLIMPTCTIPDHSVLILDVQISEFLQQNDSTVESKVFSNYYYSKEFKVTNIPHNFMKSHSVSNEVHDFILDISDNELTQGAIDRIYQRFIHLHQNEMKRTLPAITNNSKQVKTNKTKKAFWNDNLDKLYKGATKAEKDFCGYHGLDKTMKSLLRKTFKEKQALFDKSFRKAKYQFYRNKEIEIESMVGKDGINMWKSLENLGPSVKKHKKIPLEVIINEKSTNVENQVLDKWSEDFGSLYSGVPNDDPNYDNDFLTQITSKRIFKGFNEYDTETLNKPITRQEVKQAVKE